MLFRLLSVLALLCVVRTGGQRLLDGSPSVVLIMPPGVQTSQSSFFSMVVSETAQVQIKVSDGSISLDRGSFEATAGKPLNVTFGPFPAKSSSYLVRIEAKRSARGGIFYAQTFHLPRITDLAEAHLELEKSFYRPMETVRFRVLPLTPTFRVSSTPITVLIENPDELIVWRETLVATSGKPYAKSSFHLPQHLTEGRWKILVRDGSTGVKMAERGFHVMRYELPKFEVVALPNISYFATGSESIALFVLARLATGRPVSGTLTISCSSMSERVFVDTSQIDNGNATVTFNLQSCRPAFDAPPAEVTIKAEVRDFGSGEKQFSDIMIPLESKPYRIRMIPLKPGMTTSGRLDSTWIQKSPILVREDPEGYRRASAVGLQSSDLQVTVRNPNGLPAADVPVRASIDCVHSKSQIETLRSNWTTDRNGEFLIPFRTRLKCIMLMIQMTTADTRLAENQQTLQRLLLPLLVPDALSFLDLDKFQYQVGETASIRISRQSSQGVGTTFRLLVLANSSVISHWTVTSDMFKLQVTSEMLPELAVVLYHTVDGYSSAMVDDVIRVLVSYGCKRDKTILRIEDPMQPSSRSSLFNPGSRVSLILQAAQGTFVATKAMDRKLEQLARQLRHIDQAGSHLHRNRDILERLFDNKTLDGFDFSQKLEAAAVNACCAAGRVWWQLKLECETLRTDQTAIPYLKSCHDRMAECCSITEMPAHDPACQRGTECKSIYIAQAGAGINSRMHFPKATFHAALPPPPPPPPREPPAADLIRRHFPEVWLFDEYSLSDGATLATSITLPHSITNWTITGRFWSPSSPVCQVQTEIGIDMSAYMEIDLPSTVYVGDQLLSKVIIYNFEPSAKTVIFDATKPAGLCTSSSSVDWHMTLNGSSTSVLTLPYEFMKSGQYEILFTLTELLGHSRQRQLDQVSKQVYAMPRETIDSSLEYNFSWDLGAGENVNKWMNDTVMSYNFVRFRDEEGAEINASIYLTDEVVTNLKLTKMIAQFTPLPAAKRARWSKFKLANDTWRDFVISTSLTEVLIKAPSILQAVEDSKEASEAIPNKQLVQANQLLHLCQMETLSFRTPTGAYSPYRIKDPTAIRATPTSVWLTVLTTALHCRTQMDRSVVCPSLLWLTQMQNADGSFSSSDSVEFTTLTNQTENAAMLTSFALLTLRVCASYGDKCWPDERKKRETIGKAWLYLNRVETKRSDPLVVGSIALCFAAWQLPNARSENGVLLKLLEEGSDYPYWTYRRPTNGWWDKVKHGTKGWFSAEYRTKMLSCQIALNSMGLMTQLILGNPKRLNLEQIGLWLMEHRRRDGTFVRVLDTLLASRAIQELQRSMVERDSNIVTRISVQCENSAGCPSLSITPQNSEMTQTLNLNIDSRGVSFLVTGRGAVYVKFQLIASPPVRNSNVYPIQLLANTSADGSNTFVHDLCFVSTSDAIRMFVIEHTFGSGLSFVPRSFGLTKGNTTAYPPEPTSHSIHVLFADVKPKLEYCYTFQTRRAQAQAMFSLRRPIIARHPSLGIVGLTLSSGQNQGSQIPLLEKYCPKNASECICAEAACPPPQTDCIQSMCRPQHVKDLMRALCNPENAACVVKVLSQEEENTGRVVYKRFVTTKHFSLSPNSTDDECKDIDVLIRASCPCPGFLRNDYYVLVVRRDALQEPNVKGFRPTVLAGEHGFFEPFFHCTDDRQSKIHKLVQENHRQTICADL